MPVKTNLLILFYSPIGSLRPQSTCRGVVFPGTSSVYLHVSNDSARLLAVGDPEASSSKSKAFSLLAAPWYYL